LSITELRSRFGDYTTFRDFVQPQFFPISADDFVVSLSRGGESWHIPENRVSILETVWKCSFWRTTESTGISRRTRRMQRFSVSPVYPPCSLW